MFLLLLFLMMATTLINTNALKVMLPKSSNQVNDKPNTTLTLTYDLKYFLDSKEVPFGSIEPMLQEKLKGEPKPVIMLSIDRRVAVEELAKVMNIAKRNNYALFMMTED